VYYSSSIGQQPNIWPWPAVYKFSNSGAFRFMYYCLITAHATAGCMNQVQNSLARIGAREFFTY